jgi:hypothetical protein
MSSEVPSLSFGDVVSAAGLAVGLVTGCLYTAGWMYAYVYFDRFRIPLLMLDIPLEHFLVYGGLVVRQNIALALASVCAVIAPLWAVARWSAWLGRFATTTIVVLIIIAAFSAARSAGGAAALDDFAEQRHADYAAYPRVQVTWKGVDAPDNALTADILKTDCGRLLAVSKDRLFLIRPVRGAADLDLDTFILPAEKAGIRIRADYSSCP